MKNSMRLIITDDGPAQDVKLALAKEKHDRHRVIATLCSRGQIAILEDCDPGFIRVRVGEEIFSDMRAKFPTVQLMARVQLAIAAGQGTQNFADYHSADAAAYSFRFAAWRKMYQPVLACTKIIATVTRRTKKGLRP